MYEARPHMGAEKCGYMRTALVKKSRPNGKRRKMFIERLLKNPVLTAVYLYPWFKSVSTCPRPMEKTPPCGGSPQSVKSAGRWGERKLFKVINTG